MVLARGGESLSYAGQIDGWYAYINNGEYTGEQQDKLTDALMAAQEHALLISAARRAGQILSGE